MRVSAISELTGGAPPVDPARAAAFLTASYRADLGEVGAFLPDRVPLDELPAPFDRYLSACAELPDRYPEGGGGVRGWLDREFAGDECSVMAAIAGLGPAESQTLMTALSALGHTYRWDQVPPAKERFEERRVVLPPGIAGPWAELARILEQPRVGTTWSLHLCNWRLADRPGGAAYAAEELEAGALGVVQNWLRPPVAAHLERFSLSFVLLEARGAAIIRAVVDAVQAAARRDADDTSTALERLHGAIEAMTLAFSLNVRKRTVDPAIWLKLVQPTFAWAVQADEPGSVSEGPSGMQVPIVHALDAALSIQGDSVLARSSAAGRRLMPRSHRRFLRALDMAGPVLRRFLLDVGCADLTEQYNRCIRDVISFRTTHHARGAIYLRERPEDGTGRVSTGLTIGLDDDPLAVFERTMSERTHETRAATLPAPPRAATLPAP